jgi:hypothetical protein
MMRLLGLLLSMQLILAANVEAQKHSSDPFVGTFSDGSLTIQLSGGDGQYAGQATFDGGSYPVNAERSGDAIYGILTTPEGQLPFSIAATANGLMVTSEGEQYHLTRGATPMEAAPNAQPSPQPAQGGRRPLAEGFTEDSPLAREWRDWLGGMKLTQMESYSSGTAGGYSSRWDLYLCSDASFRQDGQSSVSVDVGGAFGNSGGQGSTLGRWRLITRGELVALILDVPDGSTAEYRLEYIDEMTYANGERVYVTPAEICG